MTSWNYYISPVSSYHVAINFLASIAFVYRNWSLSLKTTISRHAINFFPQYVFLLGFMDKKYIEIIYHFCFPLGFISNLHMKPKGKQTRYFVEHRVYYRFFFFTKGSDFSKGTTSTSWCRGKYFSTRRNIFSRRHKKKYFDEFKNIFHGITK